jgi:hypothetical protein
MLSDFAEAESTQRAINELVHRLYCENNITASYTDPLLKEAIKKAWMIWYLEKQRI